MLLLLHVNIFMPTWRSGGQNAFDIPDPGDAAEGIDQAFHLLLVPDVNGQIDNGAFVGSSIVGPCFQSSDVALFAAENGRELMQNAGTIIGANGDFDRQ
jgi:hypothetical protein